MELEEASRAYIDKFQIKHVSASDTVRHRPKQEIDSHPVLRDLCRAFSFQTQQVEEMCHKWMPNTVSRRLMYWAVSNHGKLSRNWRFTSYSWSCMILIFPILDKQCQVKTLCPSIS